MKTEATKKKKKKILCEFSNNRITTFLIHSDGTKERISNQQAFRCMNVQKCGTCAKGISKVPCKKQRTVFRTKQEAKEYCKLVEDKPRGPYRKRERADIAFLASQEEQETRIRRRNPKLISFASGN
jgi:hypothetical protein